MSERQLRCPDCGKRVFPTDDVCMECGADLRAVSAQQRQRSADESPERSVLAPGSGRKGRGRSRTAGYVALCAAGGCAVWTVLAIVLGLRWGGKVPVLVFGVFSDSATFEQDSARLAESLRSQHALLRQAGRGPLNLATNDVPLVSLANTDTWDYGTHFADGNRFVAAAERLSAEMQEEVAKSKWGKLDQHLQEMDKAAGREPHRPFGQTIQLVRRANLRAKVAGCLWVLAAASCVAGLGAAAAWRRSGARP